MIVQFFDDLSRWVIRSGDLWIGLAAGVAALVLLFYKGLRPILAAGGLLAVVGVFGAWYARRETLEPWLACFLFGLFASVAIASAVLMLIQRHPVYSALFFALTVLATAGMFVLGAAPFLAAALIIVYAGAIVVTFLFVVMLAQQSGLAVYDQRFWNPLPAAIASGVLLGAILTVVHSVYSKATSAEAIVRRLEQLERDLTPMNVDVTNAALPTMLGRSLPDLLAEDLKKSGGDREQLRVLLADAGEAWNSAWQGLQIESRAPQPPTVSASAPPAVAAAAEVKPGKDQSALLLATKKLAFAARRIAAVHESKATIATPPPAERARLASERSRLSTPNIDDRSMVRALGRSLWGDYLVAVEIAGTLLLVAAVGAVAINTHRKEAPL